MNTVSAWFVRLVDASPEADCVVDRGHLLSRQEILLRSARFQHMLTAASFPRDPCRIGLLLDNGADFICAFLAIAGLAGTAVSLNPNSHPDELTGLSRRLGLSGMVTAATYSDKAHACFTNDAGRVAIAEDLPADAGGYQTLSRPEQVAVILGTSGSTGRIKLVPRTHTNLLHGVRNVQAALRVQAGTRVLSVVPCYHANGFSNSMLLPLLAGAVTVTLPRFVPEDLCAACRDQNVEVLIGSPFIYAMLLTTGAPENAFAGIRLSLSSGAALAPEIAVRCLRELGLQIRQLYGSTEAGTVSVAEAPDMEGTGCVGEPVPGVEVRLAGDGEILVNSGAMMSGYLDPEEDQESPFQGRYLRMGDYGEIDGQGRIFLKGRKKRIVNLCGIKVDPLEIERIIETVPGVDRAEIVPELDQRGLEFIKAKITTKPGHSLTRTDIIAHCRARSAEYKIPRFIEID